VQNIYLAIVLAPLVAAAFAGLFGKAIGRAGAHTVTILGVAISFALSVYVLNGQLHGAPVYNAVVYEWAELGGLSFEVGFLIDHLTSLMMVVVTFVSLAVHVYTIGYMHDDPGYQRFFSYISLFTFSMLMLVMSNNFLQLFFGWEAVGVVSYLLIGFWYTRPTAIFANLKAFLVNRVGDFGFLLGIAALVTYTGTLNYTLTFEQADRLAGTSIEILSGTHWSLLTFACICLFVGAMGKSAQVPLHVWLPDSMEGPTPISALIHAATMVTAGIFMVARMSPLFEHSEVALSVVITIGALTAFFTGLLGIVQQDIKRVIAYSTLSQLGYMTVALGASAYGAGIFHLMTHAFFKALLFLAAGSVIIAMHHEQDIRKMGGLRKYLPITYWTFVIGTLALIGFPGFAGFFSKDALIEAVHASETPGHMLAYWAVLLGVFVTSLYSFRLLFVVFHGEERMDHHTKEHLHETPAVVWLPLVALAIPSVVIGWLTVDRVLFGDWFKGSIFVLSEHDPLRELAAEFHGPLEFTIDAFKSPAIYLAVAGALVAWFLYLKRTDLPARWQQQFSGLYRLLANKYYFDWFNENVLARGGRLLGGFLWKVGDETLIDGALVNGSAKTVGLVATVARGLQSGYLYHYAFAMIVGLAVLVGWLVFRT
jgi:NADH-quinone oxidoreductase subunit L